MYETANENTLSDAPVTRVNPPIRHPKYMKQHLLTVEDLWTLTDQVEGLYTVYLGGKNGETFRCDTICDTTIFVPTPWEEGNETYTICLGSRGLIIPHGVDYHLFSPGLFRNSGVSYSDLLEYTYKNKDILKPKAGILYMTNSLYVRVVSTYTVIVDGEYGGKLILFDDEP